MLLHFGTMNRGDSRLILEVLPDSGTGELSGLSGRISISTKDDQHLSEFEYTLTEHGERSFVHAQKAGANVKESVPSFPLEDARRRNDARCRFSACRTIESSDLQQPAPGGDVHMSSVALYEAHSVRKRRSVGDLATA